MFNIELYPLQKNPKNIEDFIHLHIYDTRVVEHNK